MEAPDLKFTRCTCGASRSAADLQICRALRPWLHAADSSEDDDDDVFVDSLDDDDGFPHRDERCSNYNGLLAIPMPGVDATQACLLLQLSGATPCIPSALPCIRLAPNAA